MNYEKKIEKPIFILGTGRNGSTLLHDVFTHHQNVIWASTLHDKNPFAIKRIQTFFKLISFPLISVLLRKKYPPSESYPLWDFFFRGFRNPYRDLRVEDVMPYTQTKIHQYWSNFITPQRSRLVLKITGWPRILFLKKVFPDAKFIHLVRDGRAVSTSFLKVKFWDGWRGASGWRHGILPKQYQKEWEYFNYSFIALAGINWKLLIDSTLDVTHQLNSEQFLEIRYEDFVDNPIKIFAKILNFSEIEFHPSLKKHLLQRDIKNMNYKWKEDLTPSQQEILNKLLQKQLIKYHYM